MKRYGDFLRYLIPVIVFVAAIIVWEWRVHASGISPLVLATPSDIWKALFEHWDVLGPALLFTLTITLESFVLATVAGVALAILFSQSRIVEWALYPFAVVLQVTPVVAIAPLLLIWIGYDNVNEVLVVLAWIIAFFTVLSNAVTGLKSADHNLIDLLKLYGASRWQILRRVQLPSALPYILTGMKISGGLALIGAVTAEFVAGSGNDLGLGWVITLSTRNLDTAQAFAALALLSTLGIAILFAMTALEWALLHRWHESAVKKQD
ncbi:MAG: ABC transporter permease [Alphaproteobacteria bacterium]|nr:ABC transporter permease [Alphaproteobacteria bacterium]MBV9420782.1 ABC transporter permease [Alphaproteobacteria bacterium]MBV9540640.1 ABC transporter permease [Alphaproteobacteria bacterium]MBV9904964.1 ABC transporter permease [Alphaproteobacteria bacterium]